jgi:hypothetical protein
MSTFNAETSLRCQRRLRIKPTQLFTEESRPEHMASIGEMETLFADANPAIRRGAVVITDMGNLEHDATSTTTTTTSHSQKVVSPEKSSDCCLSSSLIMQLASINIKEEKKSSSTSTITPTKRGSFPLTFSIPLQTRIKMAKRASAPPACVKSKKRVHSRRRNRVIILNNKIMTKSHGRKEGSDSCLHFEPISLDAMITP